MYFILFDDVIHVLKSVFMKLGMNLKKVSVSHSNVIFAITGKAWGRVLVRVGATGAWPRVPGTRTFCDMGAMGARFQQFFLIFSSKFAIVG